MRQEVQIRYFLPSVHLVVVLLVRIVHPHQIKMVALVVVDHHQLTVQELALRDKVIMVVMVGMDGAVVAVGGAGGAGSNAPAPFGGNGGVGSSTSITGTPIFLAGGGGGCAETAGAAGKGGNGGGGNGGSGSTAPGVSPTQVIPDPGQINTGGGGGGNRDATSPSTPIVIQGSGRSGGSGILIIRHT